MEKGEYIIDLAHYIPHRNINFYIDTCRAMSAVNLEDIDNGEMRKLKSLIIDKKLQAKPQDAIKMVITYLKDSTDNNILTGMKALGKLIATHLRRGEFIEKGGPFAKLPLTFLSYVVVEDLKLHGHGPCYSFVAKLLNELSKQEIINPDFFGSVDYQTIQTRTAKYSYQDMAAIFLGYSLANEGNLLPIVRFPASPDGFVSALVSEKRKLFARNLNQRDRQ